MMEVGHGSEDLLYGLNCRARSTSCQFTRRRRRMRESCAFFWMRPRCSPRFAAGQFCGSDQLLAELHAISACNSLGLQKDGFGSGTAAGEGYPIHAARHCGRSRPGQIDSLVRSRSHVLGPPGYCTCRRKDSSCMKAKLPR